MLRTHSTKHANSSMETLSKTKLSAQKSENSDVTGKVCTIPYCHVPCCNEMASTQAIMKNANISLRPIVCCSRRRCFVVFGFYFDVAARTYPHTCRNEFWNAGEPSWIKWLFSLIRFESTWKFRWRITKCTAHTEEERNCDFQFKQRIHKMLNLTAEKFIVNWSVKWMLGTNEAIIYGWLLLLLLLLLPLLRLLLFFSYADERNAMKAMNRESERAHERLSERRRTEVITINIMCGIKYKHIAQHILHTIYY